MKKLNLIWALFCIASVSFAQSTLTPEDLWKIGRVSDPRLSPDGSKVVFGVRTFDIAANKGQGDLYMTAPNGGVVTPLLNSSVDESSARWRPDGKKIGYMTADANGDAQLWEINADGSDKQQITFVAGGINCFGYAPSMNQLWYAADVKLDKKPSEIYPDLPKTDGARIIDGLMFRHWNAWHDYSYSHIFIAGYSAGKLNGEAKDILLNEKWDAPTSPFGGDEQVAFSPDGKTIAYTSEKLWGKDDAMSTNTEIYLYDLTSGKTSNLTEGMNGYDNDPVWSPDGKMLLWHSMETPGYESDRNRLFAYDVTSKVKKELITNFDYNVDAVQFTSDSKKFYFLSPVNATHQVFSFDLNPKAKSPVKQLTFDQADYNELTVSGMGKIIKIVVARVDMTMPSELYSINASDNKVTKITNITDPAWAKFKKATVKKRMVKTTDGKEELVWVVYPPDFDPNKKYPALLFCQGGPQSVVSQSFSYRWNFSLMAAKGYIIVAPNRRGLPSFGEAWNDQIQGDWGGQPMKDLLSAIDEVSNEPYVDKSRLGAVGASYGGFSVYWLAGNHNKRFKTFISHCGVFNLESEFACTEELFFATHDLEGPYWNTPQPKSYNAFSPNRFVKNWDTPILVIHNEKDFRVPLNQGIEAFTAAQMNNVPSRFLYFPDEGHWVLKPQNSILWQRVYFDWLDKYLK